ncbi:MAG: nucleotidyltransferase domain-containing protein [Salinibacterium sp.]|nr:nucleotidyltransferase domain-containing protein [Salinibacterium sp.]
MKVCQIAAAVGITQPAVSQQLRFATDLLSVHPELLIDAAAPILGALAEERDYARLAVFGSVARRKAREDSDIDLLVEPPAEASSFEFVAFKQLIGDVLGREIDLIS